MMNVHFQFGKAKSGITSRQKVIGLLKEIFRKSIHLCSAFVPFFMIKFYIPLMVAMTAALLLYTFAEIMRLKGKEIFLVSAITEAAARKRDENKFVLGPVTLVIGILLSSFLWNPLPAAIGIYALAFGDGLASLAGKLFGRVQVPMTQGKTAAGSLTCFAAIFISCFLACLGYSSILGDRDVVLISLKIATAGMLIEVLPLKDWDNVLIPVVLGALAQYLLS